jgi:hypothetical protein
MTHFKPTIVLLLAVVSLVFVSGGSAQDSVQSSQYSGTRPGSVGGLNNTVRQDDLDSFWLDNQNWYWYGYRPYAKVHMSRYAPGIPGYFASGGTRGGYSFGINESAGNAPWEGGPPVNFQLQKNGTWH